MVNKTIPRQVFFKPISNVLAFGFGSGLSPVAPGTVGTLFAIPLFLLIAKLHFLAYGGIVLISFLGGLVICKIAADSLLSHDHPAIVWDEVVGFFITMAFIPITISTVVTGFFLFRLFDILKPWPINHVDKQLSGGLGIMLDDVLAGICAHIGLRVLMVFHLLPLMD